MTKKILAIFLSLLMVLSILPVTAFAYEAIYDTALTQAINAAKLEKDGKVLTIGDKGMVQVGGIDSGYYYYKGSNLNKTGLWFQVAPFGAFDGPDGSLTPEYEGGKLVKVTIGGSTTINGEYVPGGTDLPGVPDLPGARVGLEGQVTTSDGKEHTFGTTWTAGTNGHYHKCTDSACSLTEANYKALSEAIDKAGATNKINYTAHSDSTTVDGICDVCSYHVHDHSLSYTVSGATLTAKCSNANGKCYIGKNTSRSVSLKLTASDVIADGKTHGASITAAEKTAWTAVRIGSGSTYLTVPTINYQQYEADKTTKIGSSTTTAPSAPGYYKASITAGSATASIDFVIYVASVGDEHFPTVEEAIEEAEKGENEDDKIVELEKDVEQEEDLEIEGNIKIKLNKHKLKLNTGKKLKIKENAEVIIEEGEIKGEIENSGKAKLDDVNVEGKVDSKENSELEVAGESEIGELNVGSGAKVKTDEYAKVYDMTLDNEVVVDLPDGSKVKTSGQGNKLKFDGKGAPLLEKGKVVVDTANESGESSVKVPDGESSIKVTLLPKDSTSNLAINVPQEGTPTVEDVAEGDKAIIDGKLVTLINGQRIKVTEPLQPFPEGADITVPKGKTVIINPGVGATSPTVSTDGNNSGDVFFTPSAGGGFPVSMKIQKANDTANIDPDGTGEQTAVSYTAASDDTEVAINANGESTLIAGGVKLDESEDILIENADGTQTVKVAVPADAPTATVSATEDAGTYDVKMPVGGAVEIGGVQFTNEGSGEAKIEVKVDADGNAVIEIKGGTVGVPTAQQVKVGDGKIENATGDAIKISSDGSVAIGNNELAYTGSEEDETGVKFEIVDSVVVATVSGNGAKLEVKPGTGNADVKVTNGNAYALVKSESAGTVEVEKTADGLDVSVTGDGSNSTKVEMGGTEYTVPENKNAEFSTEDESEEPTLISGTVELDGTDSGEAIKDDGVLVSNTTGAVLTLTEDGAAEDSFGLTSGDDTFTYTKGADDADLTVTKNGGALQFGLNVEGESVDFGGSNTQTVEFTDNGTDVFLTAKGESEGDISVSKTASGFEIEIQNESGKTSKVKAGGTEYTIPEGTTTNLTIESSDGVAEMTGTSGAVIMPDEGKVKVDGVTVDNTTEAALTVSDNADKDDGDDGEFELKSGDDTFTYTKGTGDTDLTVTKNGDALQFQLDAEGEKVEFSGTKAQNLEFSVDGTGVFLTVDKNSQGAMSAGKTENGFEIEIQNETGKTSKVKAGGTEYTIPEETTTNLTIGSSDGVAEMTGTSGAVIMPDEGKVKVDGVTVDNTTEAALTVSDNADKDGSDDGEFELKSGDDTFTYTKGTGDTDLTVTKNGNALQFGLNATGEKVDFGGSNTQTVKFTDNGTDVFLTAKGESEGDISVSKTASGFELEVKNETGKTSSLKAGATEFTVPAETTSRISIDAANGTPALLEDEGAITFGKGTFYVDSVYVTNSADETFTVRDDREPDGDNGHFTVTSGSGEVFTYYTADAYYKETSLGEFDLTIHNGSSEGTLCFTFDDPGEWITVSGANTTNTEFDNVSGEVCVTVDGNSTGEVKVTKGSFHVLVTNEPGETSVVTVGKYTYTVPENTTTLLIGTDDPTVVATMEYGTVELDKGEEVILKTTGLPYTVKNTDESESILRVTNDSENNTANLALPVDGAVTIVDKQYATLSGMSAKLTATYVEDGTGDVTIEGNKGVKLFLNEGAVQLTKNQTIHTNSDTSAQITNPNEGTVDVEAPAGEDTVITLARNQIIKVDDTEYTAQNDNTKVAVDKTTGKPKLIVGGIEMQHNNSIKVNNWTIEVPEGKPSIKVGFGTPAEIELAPGGEMIVTDKDGNEFRYVNNSKSAIKPQIDENGKLTLTLTDNASPANLPAGSYESINIRATGEKEITYTFEDDLDTVLARDNVNAGDVIVINTDLPTKPSTSSYILTQNKYTIYGVGGDLAKMNRENTTYQPGYVTVDSRERADSYGVPDMAAALEECMVIKVVDGEVFVQSGEAHIEWSDTDTTYYVTLADALFDADNNAGEGDNVFNTHNGKDTKQTIIMNINPYADREKMILGKGDTLITRGEDPSVIGDSYYAHVETTISMFENSNDVYVIDGTVTGTPGEEDTDKTVTVYMGFKDSDFYMSGKGPIIVHCCPVVEAIIRKAVNDIRLLGSLEEAALLIKSEALSDIAAHTPRHVAIDTLIDGESSDNVDDIADSIHDASAMKNVSDLLLFDAILKFIQRILDFFKKLFGM